MLFATKLKLHQQFWYSHQFFAHCYHMLSQILYIIAENANDFNHWIILRPKLLI